MILLAGLSVGLVLCLLLPVTPAFSGSSTRPFWAEKSSFIEGDDLYVVGVATRRPTVEEARQKAFEHGRLEVINFSQVNDLVALGLLIETQMTHEELNADGSITVYRLLRVPIVKLLNMPRDGQRRDQSSPKTLQQSRSDLLKTQPALTDQEREILQIYKRAVSRIDKQTRQACGFVRPGMTRAEVKAMLGKPAGTSGDEDPVWAYGNTDIQFSHNGIVEKVDSIYCQQK